MRKLGAAQPVATRASIASCSRYRANRNTGKIAEFGYTINCFWSIDGDSMEVTGDDNSNR